LATVKRRSKVSETVRQRTSKKQTADKKPRRVKQSISTLGRVIGRLRHMGRKEFYIPMPDTRLGRFLNKRRHIAPRYFRESWQELKQVTWPSRKETWKLTFAVFIFAVVFGLLITVVDLGLEKVFRKVLIKS
jgi:preprotein translocase subunit SecE